MLKPLAVIGGRSGDYFAGRNLVSMFLRQSEQMLRSVTESAYRSQRRTVVRLATRRGFVVPSEAARARDTCAVLPSRKRYAQPIEQS